MRPLWFLFLILVASLLSSTVLTFLEILGVKPDLVLVLIILYGFFYGPREGAVWGLIAGLLQDFLSGGYLGLHALEGMAAAYLAALVGRRFYRENAGVLLLGTIFTSIAAGVLHYLLFLFLHIQVNFPVAFLRLVLLSSAYNGLVALLVFRLFLPRPEKRLRRWVRY